VARCTVSDATPLHHHPCRWGDLAQLSSTLPICSEQQGAAGEVHTARLCSVHARIMAILAGMPGVHNNKRNLAWKEELALIELAQRSVELYVRVRCCWLWGACDTCWASVGCEG
jgi:hypothetical protein